MFIMVWVHLYNMAIIEELLLKNQRTGNDIRIECLRSKAQYA